MKAKFYFDLNWFPLILFNLLELVKLFITYSVGITRRSGWVWRITLLLLTANFFNQSHNILRFWIHVLAIFKILLQYFYYYFSFLFLSSFLYFIIRISSLPFLLRIVNLEFDQGKFIDFGIKLNAGLSIFMFFFKITLWSRMVVIII